MNFNLCFDGHRRGIGTARKLVETRGGLIRKARCANGWTRRRSAVPARYCGDFAGNAERMPPRRQCAESDFARGERAVTARLVSKRGCDWRFQ
jgi:hypothetical protein